MNTRLTRRTQLKPQSDRAKTEAVLWQRVKIYRAAFLQDQYGVVLCEYCGKARFPGELGQIDGHHLDQNRRNNTEENCYLAHRICHSLIHQKRIQVHQLGFEGVKHE